VPDGAQNPGQTLSRCLTFFLGHRAATVHPVRTHASQRGVACQRCLRVHRPATHVDVLSHRRPAVPELVRTRRADSAASSKIVAPVFRNVCEVTHAGTPRPTARTTGPGRAAG